MAGRRILAAAALAVLTGGLLSAQPQGEQDLVARARAIHERVITLDTHNDIDPANFTRGCNYTMRLTTQVNLPKMKEGGLDVSFMIVYVGQSNPPQVADAFSRPATTAPTRPASREVRRRPPPDRADRAERDRAGADRRRRRPHRQERQEGRGHRHRERLSDRHRHQAREGVLAARRPLHVARAQRPQPARRLEHRRGRQPMAHGAACRRSAARSSRR